MKYPIFLKENDTIGITALSDGIIDPLKVNRLNHAKKNLEQVGFSIVETQDVRTSEKGRSASATLRAKEFQELIENDNIQGILIASGGDFLLETLPFIDFSIIEKKPKWIQGYSDPTGLLFVITTKLDIATIYSHNAAAFGMEPWHPSLQDNIQFLKGNWITQHSFSLYEKEDVPKETGLEGYHLDTPVIWKNLFQDKIEVEGRMIGGCLDLLEALAGTPYDYVKDFIEKYKKDGIIWYFDNCELSNEDLIRTFWKLEVCGWFSNTKAIVLGRSATDTSYYHVSFEETLIDAFKHLKVPVIYDMDFGHVSPRMTIINGGYAKIISNEGKGRIKFIQK